MYVNRCHRALGEAKRERQRHDGLTDSARHHAYFDPLREEGGDRLARVGDERADVAFAECLDLLAGRANELEAAPIHVLEWNFPAHRRLGEPCDLLAVRVRELLDALDRRKRRIAV